MKVKLFLLALAITFASVFAGAQRSQAITNTLLDQWQNDGSNVANPVGQIVSPWQGFEAGNGWATAGATLKLKRVEFAVCAHANLTTTLEIRAGENSVGTLLHSQAVSLPAPASCTSSLAVTGVDLTSTVDLTAGQDYAFVVRLAGECTQDGNINNEGPDCYVYRRVLSDAYPAGNSVDSNIADLWFRTFTEQGPYPSEGEPLQKDQSQAVFDGQATTGAPNDFWQSFTAGITGDLARIDVGTCASSQNGILRIYAGEGTAGTLLHTQQVAIPPAPESVTLCGFLITNWLLTQLVPVVSGQQYTFHLDVPYGWQQIKFNNNGAAYAGGMNSLFGGDDVFFETYLIAPDADNDGIADSLDACPNGAAAGTDTDGDGCKDTEDTDDDNDEDLDGADNCPLDANADQANLDADGLGDVCDPDDDADGVLDGDDDCALGATGWISNSTTDHDGDGCRDSTEDADDDADGTADGVDACPAGVVGPPGASTDPDGDLDADGCKNSEDLDDDGDGVLDASDNCPLISNSEQPNKDGDALGDACDADRDGDAVDNNDDNCPLDANADQKNTDGDAFGDACDGDDDGDLLNDDVDNCPLVANADQLDVDNDNIGDVCDNDEDNDGVQDAGDRCLDSPEGAVNAYGCTPAEETLRLGADSDRDGVCNRGANTAVCNSPADLCPSTPANTPVDSNGCSARQVDGDGDGVCNRGARSDTWCTGSDLCPTRYGPGTTNGCPGGPPVLGRWFPARQDLHAARPAPAPAARGMLILSLSEDAAAA